MSTLELLLYGQLGASLVMALAWFHAVVIKNTSYVDVLWGYGVGVLGFIYLVLGDENTDPARMALLKALLLTWSIRLGTYLLKRCIGKPEDARYAYLREYMGKKAMDVTDTLLYAPTVIMFESVAFVALETGEFWAPLYTAIEKFPTIYGNGIKVWK